MQDFPHIYRWDRQDRKGQLCRVLARGTVASLNFLTATAW
jgi:hypothetical protein